VLGTSEIRQLVEFAKALPERYPPMRDDLGEEVPADVEFAFTRGRLVVLQIRPFLQNRAAAQQRYLATLDEGLERHARKRVDLREPPRALEVRS
jgi:hypothetical protein